MSSRRNNDPPKFVLPQHFSGSMEWNGTIQPHHSPQDHSMPSSLGHPTAYNVAIFGYNHITERYYEEIYHRPANMSNRAATVSYQRTLSTQTDSFSIRTTSPEELGLPSHQTTELWLRNRLEIPAPQPLNLWSLRKVTSVKKLSNLTEMIFLAIWGSSYKRLGLSEIYAAIEDRYPILKTYDDLEKAWKSPIRHLLFLKSYFVRVKRDRHGDDWMIDVYEGSCTHLLPCHHN